MHLTVIAISIATLCLAQPAYAGRSSGGSTGRSSAGALRAAATSRPAAASPSKMRAAPAPGTTGGQAKNSVPGARQLGARRSLLADGAQPSPQLAQVIRQRESSGPGWLGTAFLVSLFSQHDLSSADKQWISNKIASLKQQDDEEPELAPAQVGPVRFEYTGLQPALALGQVATIRALALDASNKPLNVTCEMPQANITQDDKSAAIQWHPASPAVHVLTCHAGGERDRRIVKAGA
ncbi:hypothetical protein ACU4GI_33450 [Cupriavidus basilensis]